MQRGVFDRRIGQCVFAVASILLLSLSRIVQRHRLLWRQAEWMRIAFGTYLPIAVNRQIGLVREVNGLRPIHGAVERFRTAFETEIGVRVPIQIQLHAMLRWTRCLG